MNALEFVRDCQQQNPIDLFDVALGVFTTDLPEELYENYDIMMTIELLADTLFEEKEFAKAEQLVLVLRDHQPEIYQDSMFLLLPELIYYHLFKEDPVKVDFYMRELAIAPEEDFLLFVHLLDVLDSYGYVEMMNQLVTDVLTTDTHLDEEDQELLESYLVAVEPCTDNLELCTIRNEFLSRAPFWYIPSITAENIIDAICDYITRNAPERMPDMLLLDENSFRDYVTSLLDPEFLDTYEYAASVLWGSCYLIDMMTATNRLSPEESSYNLEIIRKTKAFFLVNIPWDGYWRLKFLYNWEKPWSVSKEEFDAERRLIEHNLYLKPKEIVNNSILNVLGQSASNLSYAKYLEEEQAVFEKMIAEEINEEFGMDKKKDSMFPFFNYLSGEKEDELKPMPTDFCKTQKEKGGNECCSNDANSQ
ncbi:MAG: hypothetical protein ACRCSQ_01935 [Bacteroidales bacterium]